MNKRNLILSGALIASLLVFLISCDKKVGKLPVVVAPPPPGACDTITYNKHIKKIIDNNCISCHEPANTQGSTVLTNYAEVKAKGEAGRIKIRAIDDITSTRMPQPPNDALTAAQKELLTCWLNNGMKE